MTRALAASAAIVAAATGLCACSSSSSGSPHAGARGTSPTPLVAVVTCDAVQLRIRLANELGAAGTSHAEYEVRNAGGSACTVAGFPSVQLIGASRDSLMTVVRDDTSRVTATVTLPPATKPLGQPGASGHAWFTISFEDTSCAATAAEIPVAWRVSVPGGQSTVDVSARDASGAPPLVCGGAVTVTTFTGTA